MLQGIHLQLMNECQYLWILAQYTNARLEREMMTATSKYEFVPTVSPPKYCGYPVLDLISSMLQMVLFHGSMDGKLLFVLCSMYGQLWFWSLGVRESEESNEDLDTDVNNWNGRSK